MKICQGRVRLRTDMASYLENLFWGVSFREGSRSVNHRFDLFEYLRELAIAEVGDRDDFKLGTKTRVGLFEISDFGAACCTGEILLTFNKG